MGTGGILHYRFFFFFFFCSLQHGVSCKVTCHALKLMDTLMLKVHLLHVPQDSIHLVYETSEKLYWIIFCVPGLLFGFKPFTQNFGLLFQWSHIVPGLPFIHFSFLVLLFLFTFISLGHSAPFIYIYRKKNANLLHGLLNLSCRIFR